MITKSHLRSFIETNPTELEIAKYLKNDLSILTEVYAYPKNEYICIPEYQVGDRKVDYIVFTGRSRMKVRFIEIKGADFDFYDKHNKTYNVKIENGDRQVNDELAYFSKNYHEFKARAHKYREEAESGMLKGIKIESPLNEGKLFVDSNKDITLLPSVIIGGRSKYDDIESGIRDNYFVSNNRVKKIESWDSFIRQLTRV